MPTNDETKLIDEETKKLQDAADGPVDTKDAKIVPTIGQSRAQTTQEMKLDKAAGSDGGATLAAPYPADPKKAHAKAVAASKMQAEAPEFKTDDIAGPTMNGESGEGAKDTVTVRLLVDWWDGQGVRHPLNSEVTMALNEAKNLVDQRKAERTDIW